MSDRNDGKLIKEYIVETSEIKEKKKRYELIFCDDYNFVIRKNFEKYSERFVLNFDKGQFFIQRENTGSITTGEKLTRQRMNTFFSDWLDEGITIRNKWMNISSPFFMMVVLPDIIISPYQQSLIKLGFTSFDFTMACEELGLSRSNNSIFKASEVECVNSNFLRILLKYYYFDFDLEKIKKLAPYCKKLIRNGLLQDVIVLFTYYKNNTDAILELIQQEEDYIHFLVEKIFRVNRGIEYSCFKSESNHEEFLKIAIQSCSNMYAMQYGKEELLNGDWHEVAKIWNEANPITKQQIDQSDFDQSRESISGGYQLKTKSWDSDVLITKDSKIDVYFPLTRGKTLISMDEPTQDLISCMDEAQQIKYSTYYNNNIVYNRCYRINM